MSAPPPDHGVPRIPDGLQLLTAWTWRLLLLTVAAVALGWVFLRLAIITMPLFVCLLVTSAVWPGVAALRRWGLPPALAAFVTLALLAGVVAVAAALIGPSVVDQAGDLESSVRAGANDLPDALGGLGISEQDVENAVDGASDSLRDNASAIGLGLFDAAIVAANIAAGFLLGVVVLFFFLKDGPDLWAAVVRLFPAETRELVDRGGHGAFDSMSRYVRGQAVVALVDAVGVGLAMVIVGVPLALPVAVLTFFLAFIPFVGAIVSGLIATLVALATGGVTDALIILAAVTAVQQLEGDVLYPLIVGKAVALHPVVVLVGLGVGASLAGLVGAIVAVPFAAAFTGAAAARREWLQERGSRTPPPDDPARPGVPATTG